MISKSEHLTVILSDSGTYTNYTLDAANFLNDNFTIELLDSDDHLYIGYYKPFSCFYSEIVEAVNPVLGAKFEYWNGTSWDNLEVCDETKDLSRSGFISFDSSVLQSTTVNGSEGYFIRVYREGITEFHGMGCLFSDDSSLQQEFYEVVDDCYFSGNFKTHIVSHLSAKNHIVQLLKNDGYVKQGDCGPEDITCFDLLCLNQVRQASTYLALSNIFFRMADNPDSIEWTKYQQYQSMFEMTFNSLKLTLDLNNNGTVDEGEGNLDVTKSFSWKR